MILSKTISSQEKMLIRGKDGGTEWKPVPKSLQGKQKLSDPEILELSALILKIENHYGFPVDVEFAKVKGKLYVVQSRPVTTLAGLGNVPQEKSSDQDLKKYRDTIYW